MRSFAAIALLTLGLLAGCGQKGPLVQPPEPQPEQQAPGN